MRRLTNHVSKWREDVRMWGCEGSEECWRRALLCAPWKWPS
ncbi:MAG: hypothetical protein ACKERG_04550 [Candidatus Hodgkinia cicadicola]